MKPTIPQGHSVQRTDGRTMIRDHRRLPRHEFQGVVPRGAATAVTDAFKTGVETDQALPRITDLTQAPLHARPSRPSLHLTRWQPVGTAAAIVSAARQRRP
ncbi:MAG: hypothetical protein QJR07_17295 [Acetobacteraceae bacterium]|nr:hypothetical protein [Acetobacteraceae bacterium]